MIAQGLSFADIASARSLRVDTVESYISEAMAAGYAYAWGKLGVGSAVFQQVQAAVEASLGTAQLKPADGDVQTSTSYSPQTAGAAIEGQQTDASTLTADPPAAPSASVRDAAAAVLRSHASIKLFKDSLPDVTYGQIRLSLANIVRMADQAAAGWGDNLL